MKNLLATKRITLNHGWRVREAPASGASPTTILPWMPARVPGNIHLDLMRAGVIGDPFRRMMERGAAWVDEADWVYEATFRLDDPPPRALLVFKGLDTLAEITLNGGPLASTDNMFVEHEIPVADRLRAGENTLAITFRSALRAGRERRAASIASGEMPMRPEWFELGPRSFVRKAQYMFGWDWGPELVSCGIWRDVELVSVPVARLLDWRHDTTFAPDGAAHVRIEAFVERSPEHAHTPLALTLNADRLRGADGEARPTGLEAITAPVPPGGRVRVEAELRIPQPVRWRPNASDEHGRFRRAALYTLRLRLITEGEGGLPLDERVERLGLRTVELVREPDADGRGESFRFRVNGEDVFIKGANWIPADSFPGRIGWTPAPPDVGDDDRVDVARLVAMARDAGHNMLRVWGGGLYESEAFYDACDECGILVWQDFPYACAYYPDSDDWLDIARAEAVHAIRRLRNHPSLAIWCGNNENAMMFFHRWNGDNTPPRLLGERIYHGALPDALAAEDPNRPYWPSSPWGGEDPNSGSHGDRHNWDVWHSREDSPFGGDWPGYEEDDARFASEFGFASSCGMATWSAVLDPADAAPHSAAVRWHDKTRKGYDTYIGYIARHFPTPRTLEDLVYFSQCNQAEALKCAVEHYRRMKGRCWGTLYWQLNDCWPVQSWSVVDYLGQPKAAWYAARRFYAPLLVTVRPSGAEAEAHIVSDLPRPVRGTLTLRLETFDGECLAERVAEHTVEANAAACLGVLDLTPAAGRERETCLFARFEPEDGTAVEDCRFLAEPKDLMLSDAGLELSARGGCVTVSAWHFAPYVWLRMPDVEERSPVSWGDNFFHLRAGETRVVEVRTTSDLTDEAIRASLRARCL